MISLFPPEQAAVLVGRVGAGGGGGGGLAIANCSVAHLCSRMWWHVPESVVPIEL